MAGTASASLQFAWSGKNHYWLGDFKASKDEPSVRSLAGVDIFVWWQRICILN